MSGKTQTGGCGKAARGDAAYERQHNPSHALPSTGSNPLRQKANDVIHCPEKAAKCDTTAAYKAAKKK